MQHVKGVLVRVESVRGYQALRDSVDELVKLSLECRAPSDSVLFLLLDVLARHEGGVIQHHDVTLHDFVAELACVHTAVQRDLGLIHLLVAPHLAFLKVKVLLRITEGGLLHDLLGFGRSARGFRK